MVRECDTWNAAAVAARQEKCWCADILARSSLPRAVDLPRTARFIRSVAHAWTPAAGEINRKSRRYQIRECRDESACIRRAS